MDRFILVCDGSQADEYTALMKIFEDILKKEGYAGSRMYIEAGSPTEYINALESAKYVCVIDLAGSQIRTLLDDSIYNVLKAKQIHFVADVSVFEVYKIGSMALNLYLFLPENENIYREKYNHIPNLFTYPSLEKDYKGRPIDNKTNREVIRTVCKKFFDDVENR